MFCGESVHCIQDYYLLILHPFLVTETSQEFKIRIINDMFPPISISNQIILNMYFDFWTLPRDDS